MTVDKLMMKRYAIANVSYVVPQTGLKDSSKHIIDKELKDVTDNHNVQIENSRWRYEC